MVLSRQQWYGIWIRLNTRDICQFELVCNTTHRYLVDTRAATGFWRKKATSLHICRKKSLIYNGRPRCIGAHIHAEFLHTSLWRPEFYQNGPGIEDLIREMFDHANSPYKTMEDAWVETRELVGKDQAEDTFDSWVSNDWFDRRRVYKLDPRLGYTDEIIHIDNLKEIRDKCIAQDLGADIEIPEYTEGYQLPMDVSALQLREDSKQVDPDNQNSPLVYDNADLLEAIRTPYFDLWDNEEIRLPADEDALYDNRIRDQFLIEDFRVAHAKRLKQCIDDGDRLTTHHLEEFEGNPPTPYQVLNGHHYNMKYMSKEETRDNWIRWRISQGSTEENCRTTEGRQLFELLWDLEFKYWLKQKRKEFFKEYQAEHLIEPIPAHKLANMWDAHCKKNNYDKVIRKHMRMGITIQGLAPWDPKLTKFQDKFKKRQKEIDGMREAWEEQVQETHYKMKTIKQIHKCKRAWKKQLKKIKTQMEQNDHEYLHEQVLQLADSFDLEAHHNRKFDDRVVIIV